MVSFPSQALRGNPLGDAHERPLWVWVPEDESRRYPTVYVIQGMTGKANAWFNVEPFARSYPERIEELAPVKVAVLPLVGKDAALVEKARPLYEELRRAMPAEYDDSASIGKRYRRQDEIGTPWALTIDQQTLEDDTVTIRDRDTLAQERIPIPGARQLLQDRLELPWKPRS